MPFIFIGTHRVREGRLKAFKEECEQLTKLVDEKEPRLIAFNFYASDDGNEVSVVQVHPDADSMLTHMQVVREHIESAVGDDGSLETVGIQIYGEPNDAVLDMIEALSQEGVPITVKPQGLAGFSRA